MKQRIIKILFVITLILLILKALDIGLGLPGIIHDIEIVKTEDQYIKQTFIVKDYSITTKSPYLHFLKGEINNQEEYMAVPVSVINDRQAFEKQYPLDSKIRVLYNPHLKTDNYNLTQYNKKTILYRDNYFFHKKRQIKNFFQKDILKLVILIILFLFLNRLKSKWFVENAHQ